MKIRDFGFKKLFQNHPFIEEMRDRPLREKIRTDLLEHLQ